MMTNSQWIAGQLCKILGWRCCQQVWSIRLPIQGSLFAADGTPEFDDSRLGELKDLSGYFPFKPSESPEEWRERAEVCETANQSRRWCLARA